MTEQSADKFNEIVTIEEFFDLLGGKSFTEQVKACDEQIQQYNKRYLQKKKVKSRWERPGKVQSVESHERGVYLYCKRATIELYWIAADCLRVRLKPGQVEFDEPFSYAVDKTEWQPVAFSVDDNSERLILSTGSLVCRIDKKPYRLQLETPDGQLICADNGGVQWRKRGDVRLRMTLQQGEASYATGERAEGLNLHGKRFTTWNVDPPDYERGCDPTYYSIPFYLGVHNQATYGIFWDNSYRGYIDIGAKRTDRLTFKADGGELRYYLFAGQDTKSVLTRYTELTGRIQLPPLWALGYQQCRYSYHPQEEVLEIAQKLRDHNIPCDVIYLDIHYMDGYRVFTWNKDEFPDFEGMIQTLHEVGFKVITILDPGVKVDPKYVVYEDGVKQDVFVKYPDGNYATGVVWPGLCHFPDFTNPQARAWWAKHLQKLTKVGVDGIWNDMCEPVIFSLDGPSEFPGYLLHDKDGLGGDHYENHNVYGTLMGRASKEGLQKGRRNKRQVNIIRAGHAGAQRHAMSWTGDNRSTWDDLTLSIPQVLNMGLSGAPLTGPDVGGFGLDTTPELLTRWTQAASLMPFYRNHSAVNTIYQEPWQFGEPYLSIMRDAISLRYRLLPYLYSVVAQSHFYGWPIIRPIFTAEPNNAKLRSIDDSYLLGEHLLVAPVLKKGKKKRKVYLPKGQWYDFWTNERIKGGKTINVKAPLDHLPLFVKAGTILPLWPVMQHTGEHPIKTLTLRLYPGRAETTLYEDAGEGLDYLKGTYRWVKYSSSLDDGVLEVTREIEGKYVPDYTNIRVESVGLSPDVDVKVNGRKRKVTQEDSFTVLNVNSFDRITIGSL